MTTAKEMMLDFLKHYDEKKIDFRSLVHNIMSQVPHENPETDGDPLSNSGTVMVGTEDGKMLADFIHEEDEVLRRVEISSQEDYDWCCEQGCEEF